MRSFRERLRSVRAVSYPRCPAPAIAASAKEACVPPIIPIDDPDDPRIAAYRDIRERDLVGRDGHFIAEGAVVLKALLASTRHKPLSLLIAEKRLASLAPLLGGLAEDVPVYSASQAVL